jgi:hypothetical protein
MKKNIFILSLAASMLLGSAVFADEIQEIFEADPVSEITDSIDVSDINFDAIYPENVVAYRTEDGIEINNVSSTLDFDITLLKHEYQIEDTLNLELYNMNDEYLASFTEFIDEDYDTIRAHFDIPDYTLGDSFKLKLVGGMTSLKYYDTVIGIGEDTVIQTYGYLDDDNNYVRGDEFALEGDTLYEKGVNIYINDNLYSLSPRARLVDGTTMVPVRQVAQALGLQVYYDKTYDSVVCSIGTDEVIFNVGTTYSTVLGETVYAPHEPCYIDGSIYVPVRTLAEGIGSDITVYDYGEHLDVVLGDSTLVKEFRNSSPVNSNGINSQTDYLIWVSKSEFTTRVYLGSQYNWNLIKEFPCAIGATSTETITGQFEYIERISSWDYDSYYVGPVLRFYNGYALHSTLLYYGGGEYDGTVGAKISLGCVRLHPDDINWLDSYIPLGTRIYITE